MLSRLVIAFLPRSKCLLISWLLSLSTVILGAKEIRSDTVFIFFPIYLPWSDGTGCRDLPFWMLSLSQLFQSPLSPSSRGSSVPLLSTINMVSSACLRLLIFLLATLIPACDSSSLLFHMMYSAYKLNKQGDSLQPWCNSFPVLNQSIVPCLVLTLASWLAYRFLRRQVRWSGSPISLRSFHSFLWGEWVHYIPWMSAPYWSYKYLLPLSRLAIHFIDSFLFNLTIRQKWTINSSHVGLWPITRSKL